ncbi:TPM domain-containing protein [Spirosoma gilvum]
MTRLETFRHSTYLTGLTLSLWACNVGSSSDQANQADQSNQVVQQIATSLQACSYDGARLALAPDKLALNSSADADEVVREIMRYTGLPQNFDVLQAQVPNAAAIILMGQDSLPHRVIAYNKTFMDQVRLATQQNNWAPISVLAHEIGHHLCGHTIMPGGSQPPTELEADKFSGFVLYKMGALLADAQKAIQTLVPDQDSQTHPARSKRLLAIEEGWKQACSQQSSECSGLVAASPTRQPDSQPLSSSTVTDKASGRPVTPRDPTEDPTASSPAKADILASVNLENIPTKFDQFVIDEPGLIEPTVKQRLSSKLYQFTKQNKVEIVLIIAKDLQGLSGDAYAFRMLRQLRIGKLDVGNGACLVVAPNQNQVGLAIEAGLQTQLDQQVRTEESMRENLEGFLKNYQRHILSDQTISGFLETACNYLMDASSQLDWTIRFQSYNEIKQEHDAQFKTNTPSQKDRNPYKSTYHKLVRSQGLLVSKNGFSPVGYELPTPPNGMIGMEFKTKEGQIIRLYVSKNTEQLMTSTLEEGKTYSFVMRENVIALELFDLISYDRLNP